MKLIAIEEALSLPAVHDRYPGTLDLLGVPVSAEFGRHVAARLPDIEQRLADMDSYDVDVQVLSLTTPGIQADLEPADAVSAAVLANDELAGIVSAHPTRFAGFASLPLQDPAAAVAELRRAVLDLGFVGALVNDHSNAPDARGPRFLDDPDYDDLWTTLEELDVPLYLHPGAPPQEHWAVLRECSELVGPSWSWGAEAGAHALRLIYAGVFDDHPRARMILGHMGEFLPFMASRLDSRYATLDTGRRLARRPSDYLGTNVLITISGVQSTAALVGAVLAVGADAIMFAIDYPYEDTGAATSAFAAAPLSATDRNKIAHGNAERLLRFPPDDDHPRGDS